MEINPEKDLNSVMILGERVRLSAISSDYSEEILKEFTSDITRYMVPTPPHDITEVNSFIELSRKGMSKKSDLVLVITLIENGEFLGVCGLHGKDKTREPELGIWIKKGAHGHHYGREAITCLAQWAKNNVEMDCLIYPVDRDNIPSRRIAESLGGEIVHEGTKESMSGTILNEIVYRINV